MSKKTIMAATIIVFVLVVSIIVGFYITNKTNPSPQPIHSLSNFYLSDTKIFVVSANANHGYYPYPTVTNNDGSLIAENGEPCVVINVVIRNDYSTQNPAPNPIPISNNSTLVNIALHAEIFSGTTQIDSKDITNAFPIASVSTNKAFTELHYGENTTLNIYLATNSKDITSFQITPYYVGLLTPP